MIFFLILTVRRPFSRKDFKWKKKPGGTGLISEKTEAWYAELNERAEAATSSYSVTEIFLQYNYSVAVTKNHQNTRTRCLVHEFPFTYIFLTILIMVTEQLYWRKNFIAASVWYSCGYLFLLWQGAQNNAHCNCIIPP